MTDADLRPDLDECTTDAERARWLLTATIDCLIRDQSFIRLVLRGARFTAGVSYLDAELSHLRDSRRADGWPENPLPIAVARGRLNRIASGLPPHNLGA